MIFSIGSHDHSCLSYFLSMGSKGSSVVHCYGGGLEEYITHWAE